MKNLKLYKRGEEGIIYWVTYSFEYLNVSAILTVNSGVVGGSKSNHTRVVTFKKENVKDFMEKVTRELKASGYSSNLDGSPECPAPKPMLAKLFKNEKHKLIYPVLVQPKLDGFRCIAIKVDGIVSCWSRTGHRFETTEKIESELAIKMLDGEILDGELYKHNKDFNTLSGEIRNVANNSSEAQYHIYDVVAPGLLQIKRISIIKEIIESPHVKVILTEVAQSEEEVNTLAEKYISMGYEGAIVRSLFGHYRTGYRSSEVLKVKNFLEEDFKITGFHDGEGKDEGAVIWDCITQDGEEFSARPTGTYESRRKLFKEEIGRAHV